MWSGGFNRLLSSVEKGAARWGLRTSNFLARFRADIKTNDKKRRQKGTTKIVTIDSRLKERKQYTGNTLPASRARAVRPTLPVKNDYSSPAQSAQNGLRSALESLKTLVKEECMCPICLDALTDTRTNPECLHRFCGDCIIESLRRCNHECPSCRIHIPTKRTLRKDTQFDNIVSKCVAGDVRCVHSIPRVVDMLLTRRMLH